MGIEIDHLFLCCAVGAPEGAALTEAGVAEGPENTHPGQGTANRRFLFANLYLELLWVADPAEARSETVARTELWERWSRRESGACPVGVVYRPDGKEGSGAAFATWPYEPPYLPEGLAIDVAEGVREDEPLLFYLPFVEPGRRPAVDLAGEATTASEVTSVSLTLPMDTGHSQAMRRCVEGELFEVRSGDEYLVELGIGGGRFTTIDLRPDLPLVLTSENTAT